MTQHIGFIGFKLLLICLFLNFSTALQGQKEILESVKGAKEFLQQKDKPSTDDGSYRTFSKRTGVYIYQGSFKYSFLEERDGTQYTITDPNPINNFSGITSKYLIVKIENFYINKHQNKEKYKLEFSFGGELNGLEFESATPRNFLETEEDVIYLYFKPVGNNQTGFIELSYTLYRLKKNRYEPLLAEGGIRQKYAIKGLEDKVVEEPSQAGEPPVASFIVQKGVVETGEWVQFVNTSQNGATWMWEFDSGDPAISDSKEPFAAFATPGKRRVKLTATNKYGSTVYDQYVTVVPKEIEAPPPVAEEEEEEEKDVPKTGKELFQEVMGMSWEDAVAKKLVQESDYFDFQTAGEIQEVLDRNRELIPRVKQNAKGSFSVEFQNGIPPLTVDVLNNKEGVRVKPPQGNKVDFTVSDSRDHEVRVADQRGKIVTFVLPGSVEQLLAKYTNKEASLEFNISGGRQPYFIELANTKSGFTQEFALGSCTTCSLAKTSIKERLKKNFGEYNIIVKDKSKSFQNKLSDTFEYKGKSSMKLLPMIILGLLALIFIVLSVVVFFQNKK